LRERYNRYRLRGAIPIGVVSGPANALPREWARAWQLARAGDAERMDQVQEVLEAFQCSALETGGTHLVACLKRALRALGVIRSDAVARGTPALSESEGQRFEDGFRAARALAEERIGAPWVSVPPESAETGAAG
jgi:dihydrodipicolinate synthase/N-acetylneuraminate lyase